MYHIFDGVGCLEVELMNDELASNIKAALLKNETNIDLHMHFFKQVINCYQPEKDGSIISAGEYRIYGAVEENEYLNSEAYATFHLKNNCKSNN